MGMFVRREFETKGTLVRGIEDSIPDEDARLTAANGEKSGQNVSRLPV
jgi:hypothetical protein